MVLKNTHYEENLKNLLDYYIKDEQYEKCELIKNIIKSLEDTDIETGST